MQPGCNCATPDEGDVLQIRGVNVGQVAAVKPSLAQVDVLVDVKEADTVIPRNSLIEANQSGLIATPLIDITPQLPIPDYKVGPQLCSICHPQRQLISPARAGGSSLRELMAVAVR